MRYDATTESGFCEIARQDYLAPLLQVEALERQMAGLETLRKLVHEVQTSVDTLAASQGNLRAEVTEHCSHTSSLLTNLQVRCIWSCVPNR